LVDDFEVSYAPSTSVLQFCRKKARLQKKSCLIIADPRGDLKYAREEALNVSQHFEHVVVLPSNGESATVNNVKQKMPNFDVIHFACHGKFDSDAPMASFLELSATVGELGLLTVDRLYELQLNCSLVTLSACETGVSKVLSGDELIGLVRGFLFAGAPSLLVSLWSVDDRSTSELMTRFYEGYISNGESKSAALRQSMLRVKTNESTSHPYFWAPFCLIGEGT
jgi:CHAT domain-containing protein